MCGGGGGGGGFIAQAINEAVNVSAQAATAGQVRFDDGGKFRPTSALKKGLTAAKKGIKDVTGASALEESNVAARKRFDEEKQKAQADRAEAKAQSAQQQLLASRLAGSLRGGVSGGGGSRGTSRFSTLGGDEQDFLGL